MDCVNSVLLLLLKLLVHRKNIGRKYTKMSTSLEVQWLRFCASNAGDIGLIPVWELRSHTLQGKAPPKVSKGKKKLETKTKCQNVSSDYN